MLVQFEDNFGRKRSSQRMARRTDKKKKKDKVEGVWLRLDGRNFDGGDKGEMS